MFVRRYIGICLAASTVFQVDSLRGEEVLPKAEKMMVVVPVSKNGGVVSLPVVNSYPHGYALDKRITVGLGCDGKSLICEYAIPYRKEYLFRPTTKRDGPLWREDSVEIFVKLPKERNSRHFIVNMAGALFDSNGSDRKWNSSAKVRSKTENGLWSLEVVIPFSDLGLKKLTSTTDFKFNTAVRSMDAGNQYILGLFPFLPKRFDQPSNYGLLALRSDQPYVTSLEFKYHLRKSATFATSALRIFNPTKSAVNIALPDGKALPISPESSSEALITHKMDKIRSVLGVENLCGLTFKIDAKNPFAPDAMFHRVGKDKIAVDCSNTSELLKAYDKIRISIEGVRSVEFKPEELDGGEFSCAGLKPGDKKLTMEAFKNGVLLNKVDVPLMVIDETPIHFDLGELETSNYFPPMKVDLPLVEAARSKVLFSKNGEGPTSITVDGVEILAGVPRVEISNQTLAPQAPFAFKRENRNRVSFSGGLSLNKDVLSQKGFIDYDALIWYDNKLSIGSENGNGESSEKIDMVVPIEIEGDVYLNYGKLYRNWQMTTKSLLSEGTFNKKYLAWSKKLSPGMSVTLPLTSMISIVNPFRGLVLYLPPVPARLNLSDYDKYVTITRGAKGKTVTVRVHLSDGAKSLESLDFSFGLQPIPNRTLNNRANFDFRVYKGGRSGHDIPYCQAKLRRTIKKGKCWIIPFQCWTEYQNYYTTKDYADIMRRVVSTIHSFDNKLVSPYFGFEISDVCPEAALYLKTVASSDHGGYIRENRAQQCWTVCYASQWGSHWLRGIKKSIDDLGFDGMYMDSSLSIPGCVNKAHGHGKCDSRGRHLPTFPILEIRRFSQILHTITHSTHPGFMLYLHSSQPFIPATMGFVDVLLNGEQTKIITGSWKIPLDVYVAEFNGGQIGVPEQILSYAAPRTFRREYAGSLLFNQIVTPWTYSRRADVIFTEKIWTIFDTYSLYGNYFVPYYSPDAVVKEKSGRGLVSYYDTPTHLALVVSNYNGVKPISASVDTGTLADSLNKMGFDALNGSKIPLKTGLFNVEVGAEDFRFIVFEKKNAGAKE